MTHKRWQQIAHFFSGALEVDETEREEWLEKACGNDRELLEEVNSLLGAYTTPGLPGPSLDELRSLASLTFFRIDQHGRQEKWLGKYRLEELVGAGGMGLVYRAHDEHLARDVAIKFPAPAWSLNERTKKRFLNEARAAASLDHANICTIYEANETADGILYMTMAYYKGLTLQARLEQGTLEMKEVLDLAMQIARGLAAAHKQGLVHRDIKPANLMITKNGTLKILDFGIAKIADAGMTVTGQRPGTAAYMAPEQVRGGEIDRRADLWSLGVVFYEMLTGIRPDKKIAAPSKSRPEVPGSIDKLILWLLEPAPEERPEQAEDVITVLEDLIITVNDTGVSGMKRKWSRHDRRRIVRAVSVLLFIFAGMVTYFYVQPPLVPDLPSSDTHTLAVLPFTNMSGNTDDEYFSDGITEDLLTYLSRNSDLRVISRSSVMRYRDSNRNPGEIGDELGATHIVQGSVRRSDDRVRINVQLIDARTDHHLWAVHYDRELDDIFAIQADIARLIAEKLEGHLRITTDMIVQHEINPKAHDLYLQGRYYWHRRTETGLKRAVQHFEDAVGLDPGYSAAWEGLADAYAISGFYDYLPPATSFPHAREAARRALELKPNSASAWATLGYVALYYDWDLEWSEAAFRRAINLDPGSSKAHQWYADLLVVDGRYNEAERELLHAQELDPLSLIAKAALGCVYYHAGRYDEAIENLRLTMELDPDFEIAYLWSGMTLEYIERYDEALVMLEEAVDRSGRSGISIASLARLRALRGETAEADALLAELKTTGHYAPSYEIGKVYLGLGRLQETVVWLERAIEERSHSMVFLHVDPQLKKLREDPAFDALAARVHSRNDR